MIKIFGKMAKINYLQNFTCKHKVTSIGLKFLKFQNIGCPINTIHSSMVEMNWNHNPNINCNIYLEYLCNHIYFRSIRRQIKPWIIFQFRRRQWLQPCIYKNNYNFWKTLFYSKFHESHLFLVYINSISID